MKTATIFSPLVVNFIEIAEDLLAPRRSRNLQQAAWRRAVSTAYYAVLHALCSICADELVGFSQDGELLQPVYRSLGHGPTATALLTKHAAAIDPAIKTIGENFKTLQLERYRADYSRPDALYKRDQARALVDRAHVTISLLHDLDAQAKLKLAVMLLSAQLPKRQGGG